MNTNPNQYTHFPTNQSQIPFAKFLMKETRSQFCSTDDISRTEDQRCHATELFCDYLHEWIKTTPFLNRYGYVLHNALDYKSMSLQNIIHQQAEITRQQRYQHFAHRTMFL